MDGTKQGVEIPEVVAWAAGGTVGAMVGSLMGRSGAVVGALAGAVIADQIADSMASGGASAMAGGAMAASAGGATAVKQVGGAVSPGQSAGQAAAALQQCKTQLVAASNQVPDSSARTVCQMAINALNYGAVECQTVAGALSAQ